MTLAFWLSCLAAVLTIVQIWRYGSSPRAGAWWGLAAVVAWVWLTIEAGTDLWPLLALHPVAALVHGRNLLRKPPIYPPTACPPARCLRALASGEAGR